jgi:hypothetical protein
MNVKIALVGPVGRAGDAESPDGTEALAAALRMLAESGITDVTIVAQDPDATRVHFGLPAVRRTFEDTSGVTNEARETRLSEVVGAARGRTTSLAIDDPVFDLVDAIAGADGLVVVAEAIPGSLQPSAIYEYAALTELAQLFSRPIFFSAQAIDTALTDRHRQLLAETLKRCTLVGMGSRAASSLAQELLQDRSRLRDTVDDTMFLEDQASTVIQSTPYCAVAIHQPRGATEADTTVEDVAHLLDDVIAVTDLDLLLMPGRPSGATPKEPDSQKRWRARVVSQLENGTRARSVPSRDGVIHMANIVRNASLAISTGAQPLAYAVSGSVPVIGIYHDIPTGERMTSILGAAGQTKYVLPAVSVGSGHAALAVDRLWKSRRTVARTLSSQKAHLARLSRTWWGEVVSILSDVKPPTLVVASPPAEEPFPPALARALSALSTWQRRASEATTRRELDLLALGESTELGAGEILRLERELAESQATVTDLEHRLTVGAAALTAAQKLTSRVAEPLFRELLRPSTTPLAQGELEARIEALTNSRTFRWTLYARRSYGALRRVARRLFRAPRIVAAPAVIVAWWLPESPRTPRRSKRRLEIVVRNLIGPALLVLTSILWFRTMSGGVIAFDDIGAVVHYGDHTVSLADRTILDVTANRWRPVFATIFTLLVHVFGENYTAYFWFNVALTTVLALVVYNFARRLSGSRVVATATAAVVLTARFSYYQVTQVIGGPLETVCLILLVLLIGAVWSFERSGRQWWLGLALAYYILIFHTHERYFLLIAVLVPVILSSRHLSARKRLLWSGAFVLPLALSIAFRALVLHLPLLVGTGSSWELGFTPRTAVTHYLQSLAQTAGVNVGPEYLNGLTYPHLTTPWQIASIALVIVVLVTVLAAFVVVPGRRRGWLLDPGPRRFATIGVLLIFVLILSFSITIRVEPRWVYAPFVVWTLLWAGATASLARRRWGRVVVAASLVAVLALSAGLNTQYRTGAEGEYFMGARAFAADIVAKTVGTYGTRIADRPIYVIDAALTVDWATYLPALIAVNSDAGPVSVTTVASLEDIPAGADALVFDIEGGFHEMVAPAVGYELSGNAYADGWVGAAFSVRDACSRLTLRITPYRVDPELHVTVVPLGGEPQVYTLGEPVLVVTLVDPTGAGGANVTFERAFVPSEEGAGGDVRALAARVAVTCG